MKLLFLPHSLFWRPFASFWFLLSAMFLPLDPLVFHLRNYCLTVASAILLYLILRRLVRSPIARVSGVALFVISKVHLTTIGCIEMLDSLLALFCALATVYGIIVFLQTGHRLFLGAAVAFFVFAVLSRDYAVGLIVVIALLIYDHVRPRAPGSWAAYTRMLAPFAVITALYAGLRLLLWSGAAIPSSGNYAMHADLRRVVLHAELFAGDIFNVSFINGHIHGVGGLSELLRLSPWAAMVYVGLGSLLWVVTIGCRWRQITMWGFVALAALFIAPTFLVGLAHTYYIVTPLAGLAIILGIALDGRHHLIGLLRISWAVVLLITAVNGWLMQRNWNGLWWATAAADVRQTYDEVLSRETDRKLRHLTLVVNDAATRGHLLWALDPFNGPGLVQALTGNPNLQLSVNVVKQSGMLGDHMGTDDTAVYVARDGHFMKVVPLRIDAAGPTAIRVGQRFNVQASGESAMWLRTENIPPSAVIKLGSSIVPSAHAGPAMMSATIPNAVLGTPGVYPVWIEDSVTGMRSNTIQLTVRSDRRD